MLVSYQVLNHIAVITVDNPPVNTLNLPVRVGLWEALDRLEQSSDASAAVLACAGRTFLAGADISEFGRPIQDPWLPDLVQKFEDASKPIVAAIHGTALGGGLEIAMGCHYRCATRDARLGLPEVKLGVLPGAGGTQRLPRLAGVPLALDMMLTGKPLTAERALEAGVVDEVVRGDLLEAAVARARQLVQEATVLRRTSLLPLDRTNISDDFFVSMRRNTEKSFRGFYAPERIIQCVEAALELPFEEAIKKERKLFFECEATVQSRAQRHLFYAERDVRKVPGIAKDSPSWPIEHVGVVGAGTMGRGIAMTFASAGMQVTILEVDGQALEKGLDAIRGRFRSQREKGRITNRESEQILSRIIGTDQYQELADMDLIIEAVYEDLALKKEVFGILDKICKPATILASNTSTLDLNAIAAATYRPQNVIGMHFFAPANIMPLLEIVRGHDTDDRVTATVSSLCRRIGKVGVVVGVCFGFVANRMFFPYVREAQFIVLEGVTPERVDAALYSWGMAIGPLAVSDLSGLDVFHRVFKEWSDCPKDPSFFRMGSMLYQLGRYGQKTGAGFYRYKDGMRIPDPDVVALAGAEAEKLGIPKREISDEEIIQRTLFAMINEGARVLEDRIVTRSGDIDVIFANGFGLPRYRGGPMFYADTVGLDYVYKEICALRNRYGDSFWTPAHLLERLVEAKTTFAEWSQSR